MSLAVEQYLDRVMVYANRSDEEAGHIRAELADHLEQKIDDQELAGLCREDAVHRALTDLGHPRVVGYGLRPKFPWVDVRLHGTAKGVIAIGPRAVGVVAIGGMAMGLFAFGGMAVGLVSLGGFGIALLGMGGLAFAPVGVAYGGIAVGMVAFGGMACGVVAMGGLGIGLWVPSGGVCYSYYLAENVPAVLRQLDHFMTVKDHADWVQAGRVWMWGNIAYVAAIAAGLVIQATLMVREDRRVKAAGPTLFE